MKRLLNAALALSLLGATAAQADSFDHGGRQHERYDRNYGGGHDRGWHHHGDAGAAFAVGAGLIALTAILASNHDRGHNNDRYNDRYEGAPPAPDYGPGPRNEYGPNER